MSTRTIARWAGSDKSDILVYMNCETKKIIPLLCALVCIVAFPVSVEAKKKEKPVNVTINVNAGMTPSSSFYILDTLFERIGIWMAGGTDEEVDTLLKYANEKLVEMSDVAEDDEDAAATASKRYQKYIAEAVKKAKKGQKKGNDVDTELQKISSATLTHIDALIQVGGMAATAETPYIEESLEAIQEQEENVLPLIEDEEKRTAAALEIITFLQETEEKIPENVRDNIKKTFSTLIGGISNVIMEQGGALFSSLGESAKNFAREQANKKLDSAKEGIINKIEDFEL